MSQLAAGFNVQKVFHADGTMVEDLTQLRDGQAYVAGGRGRFKQLNYTTILDERARAELNKLKKRPNFLPPKKHATLKSLGHIVIPDKPKQIAVIRNGDASCTVMVFVCVEVSVFDDADSFWDSRLGLASTHLHLLE
jgi:hypothetical protein